MGGGICSMLLILLIALGILLVSSSLIPLIIKFCKKYALYDSVNARKIHSGNIPRLGGIAIFLSFIIGYIVYFCVTDFKTFHTKLPLLIGGSIIFAVGILDDIVDLRAWQKAIAQMVATAIVVLGGYRFQTFFGIPLYTSIWGRIFSSGFTFCWVFGIINSYNLIDGLDALCGTLALSVFASTAIIYSEFYIEGTAICIFMVAAVLGFLFYNWPPAKIFMGDNGSQFLGFMVAILPLYAYAGNSINKTYEFNKILVIINLVSIPMTDTIAAIWRRIRDHRPIMSPDRAHLHHKLLNLGFSKKNALVLVDTIQILICIIVLMSLYFKPYVATLILVLTYCVVMALFCMIHFTNRSVLRRQKLRMLKEEHNKKNNSELEVQDYRVKPNNDI